MQGGQGGSQVHHALLQDHPSVLREQGISSGQSHPVDIYHPDNVSPDSIMVIYVRIDIYLFPVGTKSESWDYTDVSLNIDNIYLTRDWKRGNI